MITMSMTEAPTPSLTPSSAAQAAGKGSSARGRGCKIGRGLPLQQRKAYRNLARQTPRVQGLTFDHNQIRWISYWKNDQNKQVQKHFPVSRYGFLGARRLALEERNRIMGKPADADEAAEAIANLKIDPSIPCFLEWNSPSQTDEVQAVEVEDEATCTSAEAWQDDEGDSATEAHRSETTDIPRSPDNAIKMQPMLSPELSSGQLHPIDSEGVSHGPAMNGSLVETQAAAATPQGVELVDSADFVNSSFSAVGSGKRLDASAFRSEGKRFVGAAAPSEVFSRGCKMEEMNDEFLARTITRTTTAAADSCTDRNFMGTDRTTSSASACFDEMELPPDGGLAPIVPEENRETSLGSKQTETFKRPMPPTLSPVAIAWEEKFVSCELSIDTGPMSLFCTTDGERRLPCASPSSFVHGQRRVGSNDFEGASHPICDAFINGGYISPRNAPGESDSAVQGLSSTMREVFEFCDSRKDLCASLVHDLFQGMRSYAVHSPKASSSFGGAAMIPSDLRCRDFLESEEATHTLAIQEARGFDQLEPYLEVFRHCLVSGLMPSQHPPGEIVFMVWMLHYRVLLPWGKVNALRYSDHQFGTLPPQSLSPFRERQGMTHRLLTDGSNIGAHLTLDLSATGAIGLGSPTAAVGRTSGLISPPSLFFGPAHAPSSPTAALYGGCFAKATEQEHYSAVI